MLAELAQAEAVALALMHRDLGAQVGQGEAVEPFAAVAEAQHVEEPPVAGDRQDLAVAGSPVSGGESRRRTSAFSPRYGSDMIGLPKDDLEGGWPNASLTGR